MAVERGEEGGFSTQRALADLEQIARQPRPIGSQEHARVRDLLVRQLTAVGAEATVEEGLVLLPRDGDSADAYRVRNVRGRLAGEQSGSTLLLVAHYDSVPSGPGAADDGAGVSALLETARVLAAEGPMRNPVEILFTDAEESGLAGARAFVADRGRADQVGLALNFEARGVAGPSILFETAGADLDLVRQFDAVAPGPLAISLSRDVYRLLPNTTDFEVLRDAGVPGLNFAFIDGVNGYHSRLDQVSRLDPRSLSHHGGYALSLARHFGELDLEPLAEGAMGVYFPLPLVGIVAYPAAWNLALAVLLLLAALGLAVLSSRRAATDGGCLRTLARSILAVPAALLASAVAAFAVHVLLGLLGLSAAELRGVDLHSAALAVLVLAVSSWVGLVLSKGARWDCLAAGSAVTWAVLALLAAVLLPSSAYLFVWPGLVLAVVVGASLLLGGRGFCAAVAVASLPTTLLWFPALVLLGTAAPPSAAWIVATLAALPVVGSVTQLAILFGRFRPWWVPAAAGLAALVMVGLLFGRAGYGPDRPLENSLFYVLDAEDGTARWASFDPGPDAWTGPYLGDGQRLPFNDVFEGSERQLVAAEAPILELAPPAATVVEETALAGGGRSLRLSLTSQRGAGILRLALWSDDPLPRLRVDGREVPVEQAEADGERSVVVWGLGSEPVEVEVELAGDSPLRLTTVDIAYGLPETLQIEPRSAGFAPRPDAPTDVTLVRSTHVF